MVSVASIRHLHGEPPPIPNDWNVQGLEYEDGTLIRFSVVLLRDRCVPSTGLNSGHTRLPLISLTAHDMCNR